MEKREILNEISLGEAVIVCIGTDKVMADSLGPLVGTMLESFDMGLCVYGTLDSPVHALNLESVLDEINELYPNSNILAIDACVGEEKGKVVCRVGSIRPGAGVDKELPSVGTYSIVCVTARSKQEVSSKDVRLSFIYNKAMEIADVIREEYIIQLLK